MLDAYVRGLPARRDRLPGTVARLGGPVAAIELGPPGLEALWAWVMASQRPPAHPLREEALDAWQDGPWWLPFHTPLARELGVDLSELATGLAAHLATLILRDRPDARWVLGKGRSNADFQHPLLEVGSGRFLYVNGVVIFSMVQAFNGMSHARRPSNLRQRHADWTRVVSPESLRPRPPDLSVTVEAVDEDSPDEFTHEVSLSDELAARRSLVRRVVKGLRATDGVREVHEEDREVLLVSAPGVSVETLAAVARAALGPDAP